MKKIIFLAATTLFILTAAADSGFFTGRITYNNTYTDLYGKDISDKLAPVFGSQTQYFIDNKNYKTYNELGNWKQLYNSKTNTYYAFDESKMGSKMDGALKTAQNVKVTMLDTVETIMGYRCNAVKIAADSITTIYFYSPSVKTDTASFVKHNIGEWNKYLKATGGALPLKYIMTDRKGGYTWTAVAKEIFPMTFTEEDFRYPDYLKLKN